MSGEAPEIALEPLDSKGSRSVGADGETSSAQGQAVQSQYTHPEEEANLWTKATFGWINSLMQLGYSRPLQIDDIWEMADSDRALNLNRDFDAQWKQEEQRVATLPDTSPSLLRVLNGFVGRNFWMSAAWKLVHDVALFIGPLILKELLHWVNDKTMDPGLGWLYVFGFFMGNMLILLTINQYFHTLFRVSVHLRAGLITALYQKALKLSCTARQGMTAGKITNLMSTDTSKLADTVVYLHVLWSSPFQIIVCLYLLYGILGPSVFLGLAIMILLIPIQGRVAKMAAGYARAKMRHMDERVKSTNEILHGIRIIKMYAWETAVSQTVEQMRSAELVQLRKSLILNSWASAISNSVILLVTLATFALYTLLGNELDAPTAFTSLALFGVLRFPLAMLPRIITRAAESNVSLKRLNVYFNLDELDPMDFSLHGDASAEPHVTMDQATFDWSAHQQTTNLLESQSKDKSKKSDNKQQGNGKEQGAKEEEQKDGKEEKDDQQNTGPTLKNISVHVSKHEMLAVVGEVGSGKSSLLQAILGEIPLLTGSQATKGSIAYVPQQAYIQNATVRDNILFGLPYNERRYNEALDVCALRPDIQVLPAGDETEIGEKGINLSGGQKQRISLARAVYADAQVYLLDDPLSAVDSHVSLHIFEQCITGALSNKLRVFATNQLQYVRYADAILVLENGQVNTQGSYDDLMESNEVFRNLIIKFAGHEDEENEEGDGAAAVIDGDDVDPSAQLDEVVRAEGVIPEVVVESDATVATRDTDSEEKGEGNDVGEEEEEEEEEEQFDDVDFATDEDDMGGASLLAGKKDKKESSKSKQKQQKNKGKKNTKEEQEEDGADKLIDKEERETGSVKSKVYLSYLKVMGTPMFLALMGAAFVMVQGTQVGSDFWLAWWTDEHHDLQVWWYMLGYAGWTFATALASLGRGVMVAYGNYNASHTLHHRLFDAVLHAPVRFFDTTPVGRIINRFSKDLEEIDSVLCWNLLMFAGCLLVVLSTLVVISAITPYFILPMIPIMYLYFRFQRFYRSSSREMKRLDSISRSPIYAHFSETLGGLTTIRAYQSQERFSSENATKLDTNLKAFFTNNASNRWLDVRLQFIGNCVVCFAATFAVLARNELPPGLVGLSITQALRITGNLNWAVRMFASTENSMNAMERVRHYGKLEPEAPFDIPATQPPATWPQEGRVSFEKYSMRYREGLDLALKQISVQFEAHEKVGIVGRTGSGKSSMMAALLRLVEAASGRIVVDGVDVSTIGLHALRSAVAIIPQDPTLFSGTIRYNIDPFDEYGDLEVWTALERAHMRSVVENLPGKLEEPVSEGGENFSVGEKQLLCLARALIRNAKIILLDECTAAIDPQTDELVQETIRDEFRDCTVLTIAHRLHTIISSDRILVLEQGSVLEFDSPKVLLQNPESLFSKLVDKTGSSTSRVLRAIANGEEVTSQ